MLVSFVGGPCLGKTTTAKAVVCNLTEQGVSAFFLPEFARAWYDLNGHYPRNIMESQACISGQWIMENLVKKCWDVIVTDGAVWLNYYYTKLYYAEYISDQSHQVLWDKYSPNYTFNFTMPRLLPYRQEDRHCGEQEAVWLDGKIREFAKTNSISITQLSGNTTAWADEAAGYITEVLRTFGGITCLSTR